MKTRFALMFFLIGLSTLSLAVLSFGQSAQFAISLFALGATVFCAVCVFNHFVTPLQRLIAYARQVAAGDLSATVDGKFILETAELKSALESMAGALGDKIAFMSSMLDNIPTPMAFVGPDGKITWVNRQMVELVDAGGAAEGHQGKDFSVFFYGDKRETVTDRAIRARERQSAKGEVTSRKGVRKWISVTSSPIFDSRGKLLGGFTTVFDFTRVVEKEQAMTRMNEQVLAAVRQSEVISGDLAKAGAGLGGDIACVNKGMGEQKDRVGETAAAMEQMNATVLEVARNASRAAESSGLARARAQEGEDIVRQVVNSIQAVQDQAMRLKESMSSLGRQAEAIGAIMQVIDDIADQTNLLALNAAIEAARAGDAGRGFAVVADEVRKLAEKTMHATKEVGAAIGSIQQGARANVDSVDKAVSAIEEATTLAERSGASLESIVAFADASSLQVQSIAAAAEEQSAASEHINRSVSAVDHAAEDTLAAMRRAVEHVGQLNGLAEKLTSSMHSLAMIS